MMEVDIPEVLSELVEVFESYEKALTGNDIETVNSCSGRALDRAIRHARL